jgi:hypothetical protein
MRGRRWMNDMEKEYKSEEREERDAGEERIETGEEGVKGAAYKMDKNENKFENSDQEQRQD